MSLLLLFPGGIYIPLPSYTPSPAPSIGAYSQAAPGSSGGYIPTANNTPGSFTPSS